MTFFRMRGDRVVAPLHTARGDRQVVEFLGLPGCGKTTVARALRSRLREHGNDRVEVQHLSDVYGWPRLSRLPRLLDPYSDVLATTLREPRLALTLWRRALAAECSTTLGARRVCHIIRIRQRFRDMWGKLHPDAATVVLDEGVCLALTTLARVGAAQPPPYPRELVAAAMGNIIDGVVYFESDEAECYARAIRRSGSMHSWIHELTEEETLAGLERMHKDLHGLIDVVESIGIPTLRLPWDTTVDERVKLIEQSLYQHHWGLAGTE